MQEVDIGDETSADFLFDINGAALHEGADQLLPVVAQDAAKQPNSRDMTNEM